MQLTARLASGGVLAKVTVEPGTMVAALRRSLEAAARLPEGRTVRWLAWGGRELRDEELLRDIGISGAEDVLAICADAIDGAFEVYVPGCPSCDYNCDFQRVCFHEDGIASIQSELHEEPTKYHYTLGESRGNTRQLRFEEHGSTSPKVYAGILEVSATNAINRRVKIPELDIDVQDVRYLKERGRSYVQMKMRMLMDFQQFGWAAAGFWMLRDEPDLGEDEFWEAAKRASVLWEQANEGEQEIEISEFYIGTVGANRGKLPRPHKQRQKPRWLLQKQSLEVAQKQALRKKHRTTTRLRRSQRILRWPQLP
jgi:hypothetical protein